MVQLIEDPFAKPLVSALSAIGLLYVSVKLFNFWRVLASVFVLPGKSVRTSLLSASVLL